MSRFTSDNRVTCGLAVAAALHAAWLRRRRCSSSSSRRAVTASPLPNLRPKADQMLDSVQRRRGSCGDRASDGRRRGCGGACTAARGDAACAAAVVYLLAYFLCASVLGAIALCAAAASARAVLHRGRGGRWATFAALAALAAATVWADRQKLLLPSVRGKVVVVHSKADVARNVLRGVLLPSTRMWPHPQLKYTAGLLSEMHSVLGAVVYAREHGAAGVRVELENPNYVDPRRGGGSGGGTNAWAYFYDPLLPLTSGLTRERMAAELARGALSEVHFDRTFSRYGLLGGFMDNIVGQDGRRYPVEGARLDRHAVHRVIERHLAPTPALLEAVAQARTRLFDGADALLGVHYRGTDTASEFPYRKIPYAQVADRLDVALAKARTAATGRREGRVKASGVEEASAQRVDGSPLDDVRIFVATDEAPFLRYMQARYGDAVVFNPESPMLEPSEYDASEGLIDAALPISNFERGRTALVDAMLLALCEYIIKTRSNVSDFSAVLNPDATLEVLFDVDARFARTPE